MFCSPHWIPSESSLWLLPWSRMLLPGGCFGCCGDMMLLARFLGASGEKGVLRGVAAGGLKVMSISVFFGQQILVKSAPGCFWLGAMTSLEPSCFKLFWGQPFILQLGWCSFIENNLPSLEGTHVFPIGWLILWSDMHCFKAVIKHHMKLR